MQMDPFVESKISLVTVATDSFAPGTLVMLYSFLKNHKSFKGDIVVISDDLSSQNKERFLQLNERVKFRKVSEQLKEKVEEIVKVFPGFAKRKARFYSLETFGLRGYDRVLFCDSDILFRQSIGHLFDLRNNFIVCGDQYFYEDKPMELAKPIKQIASGVSKTGLFKNTFNAGLFLANDEILTDEHYSGLLDLVDPAIYRRCPSVLTDQMVLNIHFAGKQHLISGTYNYLLAFRTAISKKEKIRFADAHVLHFNGRAKPWNLDKVPLVAKQDPAYIKACEFWFDSFIECLQSLYIQQRIS